MNKRDTYRLVLAETKLAYCDSTIPWNEAVNLRNLNFRASASVSREDAVKIMKLAVPNGYNEFTANLLEQLPRDAHVVLAREGSVCVYFTTRETLLDNFRDLMKADEFYKNRSGGECRLWWD